MKLASGSPANARYARLDRRRRDRAAAQALRAAYPDVQKLRLELRFHGTAHAPALQSHELHPAAQAFFEFSCPYADCDGSFDLEPAVRAMLTQGKHQAQGGLACPGMRVYDQGSQQPCGLQLAYQISALYRDT